MLAPAYYTVSGLVCGHGAFLRYEDEAILVRSSLRAD